MAKRGPEGRRTDSGKGGSQPSDHQLGDPREHLQWSPGWILAETDVVAFLTPKKASAARKMLILFFEVAIQ